MNIPPHTSKAWLKLLPLPLYSLPAASLSPVSTADGSLTMPAATTMQIVTDAAVGLKTLKAGDFIWDRLFAYVSWVPFSDRNLPGGQTYHMWDCPGVPQDQPALFEEKMQHLRALILANSHRPPIVLHNSEDIRYANTLLENNFAGEFSDLSKNVKFNSVVAAQKGISYPRWISPVKRNNADPGKNSSGFADRLLVRIPEKIPDLNNDVDNHRAAAERLHCAHAEGKPGWVYTLTHLLDLHRANGHIAVVNNHGFRSQHGTRHSGNLLLRQMWGQCHFLGTKIAFSTNVEGVIVVLQDITKETSGFIVSPVLPWTDDRLLSCLVALSFIAVDAPNWANGVGPGNPGLTLKDMLAPDLECRTILFQGPPGNEGSDEDTDGISDEGSDEDLDESSDEYLDGGSDEE